MTRPPSPWVLLDPRVWYAVARWLWSKRGRIVADIREISAAFHADPRPREVKIAALRRTLDEVAEQIENGTGDGTCVACATVYRCIQSHRFTSDRPCPRCGETGLARYLPDCGPIVIQADPR